MGKNNPYKYGPYDRYIEVKTPFGTWGIPAGDVLTFDDEDKPVFTTAAPGTKAAEPVNPYLQADADGNPLPPVVEDGLHADMGTPVDEPKAPKPGDPGF